MYVVKVLKGHIQFLAKCLNKEENVAWKLAIGKVCPLHRQKVRKSKVDDQSSSHVLPDFACVKRAQPDFKEGIYCKKC